jgi:hypothetical protein
MYITRAGQMFMCLDDFMVEKCFINKYQFGGDVKQGNCVQQKFRGSLRTECMMGLSIPFVFIAYFKVPLI